MKYTIKKMKHCSKIKVFINGRWIERFFSTENKSKVIKELEGMEKGIEITSIAIFI